MVFRAGTYKTLVGEANMKDPDQTAQSDLGPHCLLLYFASICPVCLGHFGRYLVLEILVHLLSFDFTIFEEYKEE